ncbi:hypothetical protein FAI40_02645 [Acetobacteraceae bacterium]|nr:hypothetical protein FAI40_02645 [Acetobacteraceae bacterium]
MRKEEREISSYSLEELDAALGIDTSPDEVREFTKLEERLIGGFEEITLFYQKQKEAKESHEYEALFAELYEIRLQKIRELTVKEERLKEILTPLDVLNLLSNAQDKKTAAEESLDHLMGEALLEALDDAFLDQEDENPLTKLRFVKSYEEKQREQAEEGDEPARRAPCENFEEFSEKFDAVRQALKEGSKVAIPFRDESNVEAGQYFILKGQICYVAEKEALDGQDSKGNPKARLRVIFDNEMESPLQQASLWRRLSERKNNGRRIVSADKSGKAVPEVMNLKTGSIYVLRSLSQSPEIAEYGANLVKIGVTTNLVKKRLANAKKEATYLYAPVEILQTYEVGGKWSPERVEKLLHKIFGNARARIKIPDGLGNTHKPREWFVLPLFIIDEFVTALQNGRAEGLSYDYQNMRLARNGEM